MHALPRSPRIALGLIAALAALSIAPAITGAAPPVVNTIVVDAEFVDGFWSDACGFAVRQRIEGVIRQSGALDADGNFVPTRETFRLRHTLLGPGGTLTSPDVGADYDLVFNPDGTLTVTATGIILRLVVPGEGLVYANIGRHTEVLTFDPVTGEIVDIDTLWQAGQSPEDFGAADLAAVCAALAG